MAMEGKLLRAGRGHLVSTFAFGPLAEIDTIVVGTEALGLRSSFLVAELSAMGV
jgi:hypothetical protein